MPTISVIQKIYKDCIYFVELYKNTVQNPVENTPVQPQL